MIKVIEYLVLKPVVDKTIKKARLQQPGEIIVLLLPLAVVLCIGGYCAYDAYKTTHSAARAAGGFCFPFVYLTLVKKW